MVMRFPLWREAGEKTRGTRVDSPREDSFEKVCFVNRRAG